PGVADAARDSSLDAPDERHVLAANLGVERDQLVDPLLCDAGGEEVVEPALRSLRSGRDERAAGEVRMAGKDVDPEVRPQEVELAVRDLPARQERGGPVAELAELRRRQPVGLQSVPIRRHVDRRAEARVRDGAVVALEEVLARDLPVRLNREIGAEPELELVA